MINTVNYTIPSQGEGQWEKENVQALYEAHKRFPGIALVDLGCNIGMFTLPAAKMGMEVCFSKDTWL